MSINTELLLIEAGHFYLHENPSAGQLGFGNEQQAGLQLALQLAKEVGISALMLLFVDDFHNNPNLDIPWEDEDLYENLLNNSDVKNIMCIVEAAGLEFSLISELAMTSTAMYLYSLLLKKGLVSKGGKALKSEYGSISLLTKEGQPSCSLIDAALYLKKVGPGADRPTITFLPMQYKKQQQDVRTILTAFGYAQLPVEVFYHDEKGEVLEVENWSHIEPAIYQEAI